MSRANDNSYDANYTIQLIVYSSECRNKPEKKQQQQHPHQYYDEINEFWFRIVEEHWDEISLMQRCRNSYKQQNYSLLGWKCEKLLKAATTTKKWSHL